MKTATVMMLATTLSFAADYSAQKLTVDGIEVVRLRDAARDTQVSIVPSLGNNSYEMKVRGENIFWSPYATLAEFKAKPAMAGNPLLAPWANRLDQEAFFADGQKYLLNPELKNFRYDAGRKPIHGLLVFASAWKVVSLKADDRAAEATSRLEFWRYPGWMAQFPFAHTLEMTYRLAEGALEVITSVENHASQPMPLSLGYHPYFRIPDSPRDDWKVHIGAKEHVVLSRDLIPTGEVKPASLPDPLSLGGTQLDDVFTGLVRDAGGRAEFYVQGKKQRISVLFGPRYTVAVVYAPRGRDFICLEPMTGPTNAFNLAHQGLYKELQWVRPGAVWRESFWIRPSGF